MSPAEVDQSKRNFMIKAAYVAPIVATVSVLPRFASAGSTNAKIHCDNGVGTGPDCLPNGLEKNGKTFLDNDDGPPAGVPGGPLNQGGNGGNSNTLKSSKPKNH